MHNHLSDLLDFNSHIEIQINDANKTHILVTVYKNNQRITDIGGIMLAKKDVTGWIKSVRPGRIWYEIEVEL